MVILDALRPDGAEGRPVGGGQPARQAVLFQPGPPLAPGPYWFVEVTSGGETRSLVDHTFGMSLDGVEGVNAFLGGCGAHEGTYTTSTGNLQIDLAEITAPPRGTDPPPDPEISSVLHTMIDSGGMATALDGDFLVLRSGETSVLVYAPGEEAWALDDELVQRWQEMRRDVVQLLAAR